MAETKIGGRDIRDGSVTSVDLDLSLAPTMAVGAGTNFIVLDSGDNLVKKIALSVLETYFNTKYNTWRQLTGTVSGFVPTQGASSVRHFLNGNAAWSTFGTAANTIAEGNDSRINNGQTAFSWGNHAGLYRPISYVPSWSSITSKPTTISGYGITDFNSLGDARWSLSSHVHTFASLTSKPTTLSGYGITDAPTLTGTGASGTWSINVTGNAGSVGGYSVSYGGNPSTIPLRNEAGYLEPNNWIQLNGHYGLYSPTNNAHIKPNDGTYGAWKIIGSRNGWGGIEFDTTNGGGTYMVSSDGTNTGFHMNNYGWQWRWNNGTMYVYKNNPYGSSTEAALLDTSNFTDWVSPRWYDGWVSAPGYDANTIGPSKSGFTYSNNAPRSGCLVHFDAGGYGLQINSDYGSGICNVSFRARNGDAGVWGQWGSFITSANIGSQSVNYANIAGSAGSAPNAGNINPSYLVSVGDGNGIKFWASDNYKISMGVGSLYQYGPVTDYSIKMQMDVGSTGRGFTWGREGNAPIAALNSTSGNFQTAGTITAGNDVIAFSSSDKRLKDNIQRILNPIDKIMLIGGYTFDWNSKQDVHSGKDVGVIAQEIEAVIPEIVTTRDNGYKAVKYDKLVALLIEGMKEQQLEIEKLKKLTKNLN